MAALPHEVQYFLKQTSRCYAIWWVMPWRRLTCSRPPRLRKPRRTVGLAGLPPRESWGLTWGLCYLYAYKFCSKSPIKEKISLRFGGYSGLSWSSIQATHKHWPRVLWGPRLNESPSLSFLLASSFVTQIGTKPDWCSYLEWWGHDVRKGFDVCHVLIY